MSLTVRRVPYLLLALIALAVAATPADASRQGFQFRTEGASAEFSFTDPSTGYVTDVAVYAAADQGYRAFGDTGQPERISKVDVSITQYDPSCVEGGGGELEAQKGPGEGPACFYRSLSGTYPDKSATAGLPADAFAVGMPHLDGAWLAWTLTLSEWGPDGESILQESTIALTWTATGPKYPVRDNWLVHYPPYFVATGHVNAQVRQAVATGTLTIDGVTYDLTSASARIFDAQEMRT